MVTDDVDLLDFGGDALLEDQLQVDAVEQGFHRHVGRLVDDHAQHALVVMLADIDDGAAEDRILDRWHGDQEMVRKVEPGCCRTGLGERFILLPGHARHR